MRRTNVKTDELPVDEESLARRIDPSLIGELAPETFFFTFRLEGIVFAIARATCQDEGVVFRLEAISLGLEEE